MYEIDPKYDEIQRWVICLDHGYNLVLAPAGCGKTDILAERVARAIDLGVNVDDMLCLTFTNRAARGMRQRIQSRIGVDASGLFVGNTHRFCSKFLFDNNIVSQSTTILDEDDSYSVITNLSDYVSDNPGNTLSESSFSCRNRFTAVMKLGFLMKQYRAGHPRQLWLYRESSYQNRDQAHWLFSPRIFNILCKDMGMLVTIESIINIYENIDDYIDSKEFGYESRELLKLMKTARDYERYKDENCVMDFDDILFLTYEYARHNPDSIHKYSWIQIDEVQDLNPLQFAIVDAFTADDNVTVYLGDEQQAIFSFLGAKLSALEWLKDRCGENIIHLEKCYRSPKYLLDFLNDYANLILDTDPAFLPKPTNNDSPRPGDMTMLYCKSNLTQSNAIVRLVNRLQKGRTAILVNSNDRADIVSNTLKSQDIPHFCISGADLFTLPSTKMLIDHLNVVYSDINYLSWSRLIAGMNLGMSYADARSFVRRCMNAALMPSDFILRPDSSYLLDFIRDYSSRPVVIFDTETTGLDILEDDIVQIAATKYVDGIAVSTFNILLHTDREIPPMLGDLVNPLVEEYGSRRHLDRSKGLREFVDYARGCVLIGHNVNYDYQILIENCRRDLAGVDIPRLFPTTYDTLKLARILCPSLKSYKLKDLLSVLDLEGSNSHLADEDIVATYSVAQYCFARASELAPEIRNLLAETAEFGQNLRSAYGKIYKDAIASLHIKKADDTPALVSELRKVHGEFVAKKFINPIAKFEYICRFLEKEVIDLDKELSLGQQLSNHAMDLNTYREADLCDNSIIDENIFVSTVHKAKGLEFENVIVCDCVDGVYPFFANQHSAEAQKEDARKLYVALSRAKHSLTLISYRRKKYREYEFSAEASPFLQRTIGKHNFTVVDESK